MEMPRVRKNVKNEDKARRKKEIVINSMNVGRAVEEVSMLILCQFFFPRFTPRHRLGR